MNRNDVTVSVSKSDGEWIISMATGYGLITLSAKSELAASEIVSRLVECNQYTSDRIVMA